MPYIISERRVLLEEGLHYLPISETKGDLEFVLFWILNHYMTGKQWNYSNLHDAVYAAQHVADEFRRRFLDPREDEARARNGDIP